MKTIFSCLGIATLLIFSASDANAQTVASEDFDGGATNLLSSVVPTEDGGGGDTFAVGATAAWPTTGGSPFSLTDNSVGDVGDSTFFAGDNEGVYGVNSNFNNNFIGISDSDEFGDVVATWDFDISSASDPLFFSIDAGSMEGSAFAYSTDTILRFEASIDGGSTQTVFDIIADASGDGYAFRPMDDGAVFTSETNALLATGDNAVTKLLAETGLAAGNQFLDKSLAADGSLDTFQTALNGNGNTLTITFTSNVPFEGAAFDNLRVFSTAAVPEPSSALLGCLMLGGLFVRRKRS